jgi:hypothetical protein
MTASMKYHLSNRQAKDLYVRATQLIVALPFPGGEDDDPLTYARRVLAVEPSVIASVEEAEIEHVIPVVPSGDGLTRVLGKIVDGHEDGQPTIVSVVVLVTLRYGTPRHISRYVQWPGELVG